MRKEMELIAQVQAGTQSLKPSISAEHRLISKAIFTPTHTFTYVIYLKASHTSDAPTHMFLIILTLRPSSRYCIYRNQSKIPFTPVFSFAFTPLCAAVEAIISHDSLACAFESNQRIVILIPGLFTCGKIYKKHTKAAQKLKGHASPVSVNILIPGLFIYECIQLFS